MSFRLRQGWRADLQRQLAPIAERAAELVSESVVEVIETATHTGEMGRDPRTGAPYRMSAPGEPPASPTGVYPDSWGATGARASGSKVEASAYTDSEIAPDLEYGTAGPPAIEPRPHVDEAIQRAIPKIRDLNQRAGR